MQYWPATPAWSASICVLCEADGYPAMPSVYTRRPRVEGPGGLTSHMLADRDRRQARPCMTVALAAVWCLNIRDQIAGLRVVCYASGCRSDEVCPAEQGTVD